MTTRHDVMMSAAHLQMMVFPPPRYIVPGLVPEGLTLLAGKPKIGKSWLCLELAYAIASGGEVLNSRVTDPGDVLYLALEDSPRRLQHRLLKQWGDHPWPERLMLQTSWSRLDQGGAEQIRDWLGKVKSPRAVFVDILGKVRPERQPGEKDYDADYRALGELQTIATSFNIALIAVHHLRKMTADDPLDMVSGSTGLTGAADTILILHRGGNGVTFRGLGRDIEEYEETLVFDDESCRWTIAAADVTRSPERNSVLRALAQAGKPLSPLELSERLDISHEASRQILTRMLRAGDIRKVARGQYVAESSNECHIGHSVTSNQGEPPDGSESDMVTDVTAISTLAA